MTKEEIFEFLTDIVLTYGLKIIGAIIVWTIGWWLIKLLSAGFSKFLNSKNTDENIKPLLKGTVNALLKVMLTISVLSMLGVAMTSFVAVLGAMGLAVGLALSGTLQNFAGGVIILALKPFKVGHLIEAQGHMGVVNEIQVFNTILKTPNNKTVIIPNGGLSTAALTNYSLEPTMRVDWTIGIAYGDDAKKAEGVIKKLCDDDSRILRKPPALIAVSELADHSVNFTVRAWVKTEDYWDVFFAMNKKVYETFDLEGLNIPFPQMDVHLHKN
jgi:small conductance mechanosensitive channel